jgi:Na+/proline symporter
VNALVEAIHKDDIALIDAARTQVQQADEKSKQIKKQVKILMESNDASSDTNDSNYIFLTFVTKQLPVGIVGILIAIIFLAAMGSTASGLNSLASTTVVDFYKRIFKKEESDAAYVFASRLSTVAWGIFCIIVAIYASKLGNLIEAVNILGSLFYGTILGIFLVAFYMKSVSGKAVFIAAIIAEIFIVISWLTDLTAFLWLNVIGCLLVMGFSFILQKLLIRK